MHGLIGKSLGWSQCNTPLWLPGPGLLNSKCRRGGTFHAKTTIPPVVVLTLAHTRVEMLSFFTRVPSASLQVRGANTQHTHVPGGTQRMPCLHPGPRSTLLRSTQLKKTGCRPPSRRGPCSSRPHSSERRGSARGLLGGQHTCPLGGGYCGGTASPPLDAAGPAHWRRGAFPNYQLTPHLKK